MRHESHFCLSLQCSPHCMQTALFPVIQLVHRLSGLSNDESDSAKLDKVRRLLSLATKEVEAALPFISDMMSIPFASARPRPALSAKQVKVQTLSVLVELLHSLSAKRPIYCLVEDIQWIDPSTQELLPGCRSDRELANSPGRNASVGISAAVAWQRERAHC